MKFELRPAYADWPASDRKSLHVDQDAFAAIHSVVMQPDLVQAAEALALILPVEVLTELKKPMYHGSHWLFGMSIYADL